MLIAAAGCVVPTVAFAQSRPDPVSVDTYRPITSRERALWVADGVVGRWTLLAGAVNDVTQTAWNTPPEWGRTWSGAAKRFGQREADVALSNTIEAGLGALWSEEPRYVRSGRHGVIPRFQYAVSAVVLTQRRDGHLAPAWGRYAGNVFNNVIENAWLPPSQHALGATAARVGAGFVGRFATNLWEEFGPDVRRAWSQRGPVQSRDR
jgi:hypothetical protein